MICSLTLGSRLSLAFMGLCANLVSNKSIRYLTCVCVLVQVIIKCDGPTGLTEHFPEALRTVDSLKPGSRKLSLRCVRPLSVKSALWGYPFPFPWKGRGKGPQLAFTHFQRKAISVPCPSSSSTSLSLLPFKLLPFNVL